MPKTRILIVEDESLVARDIQAMVLNLGFAVAGVAASGELALKKVEEAPPDLVLMDIVLKGSLDGIATAAAIRRRHDVPVIYLTAYADEATINRAKLTEPFGYLLKPFEERELQTTIEMALYKHAREARLAERERWTLAILDSIADAVVAVDVRGRVAFMNALAGRITGWDPGQASGRPATDVLRLRSETTGRPALPAPETIIRKRRWAPPGRLLLTAKDLRSVSVEVAATLLHDPAGTPRHIVFLFRSPPPVPRKDAAFFATAVRDPLTGLPNRFLLADRLTLALAHARRDGLPLVLILVAPDGLPAAGTGRAAAARDVILRTLARRLTAVLRKTDTVARFGDDSFMLILPDLKKSAALPLLARRIQKDLRRPFRRKEGTARLSVSMGICLFPGHGEDVEALTRNVASALGRARAAGGNGFHIFAG
ncbi:MAG: diguanylate cyclase [Candidatus Aminicenantes bacterium]|nr:diguanylate cyclase [Candidatus Aminicenantes bacterium]